MEETTPTTGERDIEREKLAAALPAYEIGPILGRGAFAVVYAARHRRLNREVAIKRLSGDMLRESEARGRFAAEARLLASLDHPHVVRVYDYVEEEEVCAFVMERMHGGSLADRAELGRVARPWALAVIIAALHGLEHAHRKGVLHRDVKPENLLFAEESHVKVADFGIAKVVGAQGARLTATAAAIGTPAYMAPEQVTRAAGPLSAATDVWQTAAVLYELIAAQPPFDLTGDIGEILFARTNEDPRPLHEVAPDVPAELSDVVMRGLARDPRERFKTAASFAAALEPVAEKAAAPGGLAATGVPIHRTATRPEELVPTPPAAPPRAPARLPRRRWLLVGAAAVAVLAAAVAVLAPSGGDKRSPSSAPARTSSLPAPPVGWPKQLIGGYFDQVSGPAGVADKFGAGGAVTQVYYGDAAAKKDWSHDPNQQPKPTKFVADAKRHGVFPYMGFYSLRALGQYGEPDDADAEQLRKTLVDHRLMRIYWGNVKKFLQQAGVPGVPAAVSLDSNIWSYLEQQLAIDGKAPSSVRALVGGSGLAELKGQPDTLAGVAKGWRVLRDKYAPKVLLGYIFDDWASGPDISRANPARGAVVESARRAAEFYNRVAVNDLDFAVLEINGEGAEAGQNSSPNVVYSDAEKESVLAYVREFVRVTDVPMALEGVPLGNTVSKSITDKPYHWHDSWVQWLVGDKRFTGLRAFHDAGVIGVMYGVNSGENETCPCDAAGDGITAGGKYRLAPSSADDDGGYFADRMKALQRAGGMTLE